MSIVIPEYEPIPTRLFRLRWRFEFAGGKAPRQGIWDGVSDVASDSAWAVNKTGLVRAIIEGEDRLVNPGEVRVLAECDGQDYATMQWEAYSRLPAFFQGNTATPRATISGLSILTRDEKITAWVNGRVTRKALSDDEKKMQFHEHSLGSG